MGMEHIVTSPLVFACLSRPRIPPPVRLPRQQIDPPRRSGQNRGVVLGLGKLGGLTLLRLFLGPRGQWVPRGAQGVPMGCR